MNEGLERSDERRHGKGWQAGKTWDTTEQMEKLAANTTIMDTTNFFNDDI